MDGLHDTILIVQPLSPDGDAPHGFVVPPPPHDVGVEAAVRVRQLDVPLAQTLGAPAAAPVARDPLLTLAPDVAVVVETVVVHGAATGIDALVGRGGVVAVGGVGVVGRFEGAEAEDAGDEGPEVGDVGDDDGGRGFTGVPVEVDEGAVAGGKVVVAVQDGAQDDEGAEGEDAEEDDLSRGRVSGGWMERTVFTDLLMGSCALINNGMGKERMKRSEVMLKTASVIRWL